MKPGVLQRFLDVVMSGAWRGEPAMQALHASLGIAPTPRQVVHDERAFEVYHYPAISPATGAPPLLIVPSLINHWYVLDLMAGHSTVAALQARGLSVYVLAWRGAHDGMGPLRLPAYIDGYLDRAVEVVRRHACAPKISLMGQCLGGTLAVAYTATHPETVDRLVALTAPVDFRHGGLLGTWSDRDILDARKIAATYPGALPDSVVYGAFPLLNPRVVITKHRTLWQMLEKENEDYVRLYQALDLWTTEHLTVGSGAFLSLIEDLYQHNRLFDGTWALSRGPARLEDIRCPVMNVLAKKDDIVPLASAQPLLERTSSVRPVELVSPMGHITLVLGSASRTQTWEGIADFCRAAAPTPAARPRRSGSRGAGPSAPTDRPR